jgi:hypothetical protein
MRSAYVHDIKRLAHAIRCAAGEHGVPNRFSPAELVAYGAPKPTTSGRLGRWWLDKLREEFPLLVAYRDRHFVVEEPAPSQRSDPREGGAA